MSRAVECQTSTELRPPTKLNTDVKTKSALWLLKSNQSPQAIHYTKGSLPEWNSITVNFRSHGNTSIEKVIWPNTFSLQQIANRSQPLSNQVTGKAWNSLKRQPFK